MQTPKFNQTLQQLDNKEANKGIKRPIEDLFSDQELLLSQEKKHKRLKRSSDIQLPEPRFYQDAWQINVPRDSDCLFVAAALAYLIPFKDNNDNFETRFKKLFENNNSDNFDKLEEIKGLVQDYNPFSRSNSIYGNKSFQNLIKEFRNNVIEYMRNNKKDFDLGNNPDDYLSNMEDSNIWGSDEEKKAIKSLLDVELHAFGRESENRNYYGFCLDKKVGDNYKVDRYLEKFIKSFVSLFEVSLSGYYDRLINQIPKAGKWPVFFKKVTETVSGGVEGAEAIESSVIKAIVKSYVGVVTKVIDETISGIGADYNRGELKKLITQLYIYKEHPDEVRKILVESSVNIFQSFESQFIEVTTDGSYERAMEKLAHDAVNRVINFERKNPEDELFAITKGVILGESKKYKSTSFPMPYTRQRGHTVEAKGFEFSTTEGFFKEVGLATKDNDNSELKYYKRQGSSKDCGFRLLFEWENNNKKINGEVLTFESELMKLTRTMESNFKALSQKVNEKEDLSELIKSMESNFKALSQKVNEKEDLSELIKSMESDFKVLSKKAEGSGSTKDLSKLIRSMEGNLKVLSKQVNDNRCYDKLEQTPSNKYEYLLTKEWLETRKKEILDRINNGDLDGTENLGKYVEQVRQDIQEDFNILKEDLNKLTRSMESNFQNLLKQVKEEAEHNRAHASAVGEGVKAHVSAVGEDGKEHASAVGEGVKAHVSAVGEGVEAQVSAVGKEIRTNRKLLKGIVCTRVIDDSDDLVRSKINKVGVVQFEIGKIEEFKDYIDNGNERIINIIASQDSSLLTIIKANQALSSRLGYKFAELDSITEDNKIIANLAEAFSTEEIAFTTLIIDCTGSHISEEGMKSIYDELSNLAQGKNKKVIMIIKEGNSLSGLYQDKISFNDLILDSQKEVLNEKVIFQGDKVPLNKLIGKDNENLEKIISAKVLSDLVYGKSIVIGEALPNLGIIKDYYIDRKFNRQVRIKKEFLAKQKEQRDDIFIIIGNINALKNLQEKITENDKDQVTYLIGDRDEKLRFFLREDNRADDDFKNLCDDKDYSQKNIHLLRLSNEFTWEKSYGSLKNLRKYLDNVKQDKNEIVNGDFLKEQQQDDIFVIINKQENFTKLKFNPKINKDQVTSSIGVEEDHSKQEKLRFFLLSSIPTDDDFKKLCDHYSKKGNIQRNVHLLSLSNDGKFTREKSHRIGNTVAIDDKVAIISAEPGMGKSTVLTDLAKKIKEESKKESKELWVVKINLNDRTLLKIDIDPVIESPEDKDKRVIKSLLAIMKIDTPRQIDTDLEIKLFEHLFKQGKVVLLFDAFDEIGHDSEKKAIKLLQDIRDINKVEKLLVTTRTHKQRDLEDALGVFSYALEPLLPEEQKEFLERFWRTNLVYDMIRELTVKIEESLEESSKLNEINKFTNKISKVIESEIVESRIIENGNLGKIKELISKFKNSNLDKKKLEEITKLIGEQREASDKVKGKVEDIIKDDGALNTIKEDAENYANKASVKLIYESPIPVSPKEREFTEIPLQIRMLAEAFQGDFEEGGELVLDVKFTLLDLYRKFIESKYDTYFRKHLKEDLKGDKLKDIRESVTRTLMKEHRSMALEVLFSKEVKDSLRDKDLRFKNIQDVGIIEKIVNDSPSFIHRTFAEYFAADFFVDALKKPGNHPKYQLIHDFLRDNIFKAENEVIRNFFDRMLANDEHDKSKYEIHVAVLNNNEEKVKELLKNSKNINSLDKANRTPLHLAAAYGYKGIVQILLEHNADVNVNDKVFDWNPLAYSVKYSGWYEWKDIAKSLLRKGVSGNNVFQAIEIENKEEKEKGQELLYIAAKEGYAEFIKAFLNSAKEKLSSECEQLLKFVNAEDYYHMYEQEGYTPLQWAVKTGDEKVIVSLLDPIKDVFSDEQLLKFVSFVNEPGVRMYQEYRKENRDHRDRDLEVNKPLCIAIKNGNLDIVKLLVEKGADLNIQDKDKTLLHLAAQNSKWDVVKYLIEKGADLNIQDKDGKTPLHLAAEMGNLDLVKYLVEKEASLNIQDKDGKTPLHLAAQNSKWDVVKYLIEKGADLNIQDKDGKTPLHLAAEMGNLDLVKYLVEKEASLNIQDKDGKTPLHLAAENDKLDAVKYLVEKGASLNVSGNDSNTASKIFNEDRLKELLHLAVRSDNRKFVEVALKELNVDVKYKYGGTPLHLAAYSGKLDIVKYLIGQSANVNAKDENKRTPLHDAAENGYLEVVEYLIKNRAHVDAKDNEEQTPLDLVKKCLKERSNLEKAKQAYQTIIADLEAKDKRTTSEQEILDFNKERLNQLISKAESANPEVYERIINALQQKLQELWKDYIRERQEVEALECLSGRRKRETKAGECELSWDDMDKFSEEKEGIRDFSKIKINSDKFINYIKSESISGNKLEQLVQLAGKVQVTGKFQGLVSKLISNQKVMNHLNRVGRVSGIAMHGMMGKNVVADFLNGDYTGVAVNVGFIAGGQGFAKVAEAASLKGTGLVLDGKLFLGRSLKAASPFLARGTSAFVVYDLVSQIKEFKNGTEEALVSVIGDSIYLGVDAAEIGIEIAEAFDMFEGVSAITGPIGAAIGAVIFVGTDIYLAVKRVDKINEIIHLKGNEKFIEGLRAFIGMQPEQYIEELMEEKQVNNQLVKQGLEYLKQHSDIKRYVFPTGKSVIDSCRDVPYKTSVCVSGGFGGGCSKTRTVTRYVEECTTKIQVDLDSKVLLDEKRTDIKWSRIRPDNPSEGELFCLPQGDYEQVPSGGAYLCDNAIGITDSANKTGNYTLINLGKGNDHVEGFPGSHNIFMINDGVKKYYGGKKDDTFIVQGNIIKGDINGGEGVNSMDLEQFAPEQKRVQISTKYITHSNNTFGITNIHKILARREKEDTISCACDTKHVDGRGGKSNAADTVIIPSADCSYELQVVARPSTIIYNHAQKGNFTYIVPQGKGEALINLKNNGPKHNFLFDYAVSDLEGIDAKNIDIKNVDNKVTFSFLSSSSVKEDNLLVEHARSINIIKDTLHNGTIVGEVVFNISDVDEQHEGTIAKPVNVTSVVSALSSDYREMNSESFNVTISNKHAMLNAIRTMIASGAFGKEVREKFNVTIEGIPSVVGYILNDGTEIKIGSKGNLYAIQNSNRSIDEIISNYPAMANRLRMSLFIQSLLSNETIAIGHGNHDVLHNNPYYKSHLIGNGGENIFVVTSGHDRLDKSKLPIPEVIIYDVDKENLIDTLDLRQIKQQIVKDLSKEVKARTGIRGQDLLIELFYPNSTQSLVTVRLKDALETNWHERLHVILNDSPMKIEEFKLKPLPLIFDESDKNIIVIGSQDVEEENIIVVSKEIGNYTFARLGNDLIITNAPDCNLTGKELCTIFLSEFYQEPKMQILSIIFTDQKISLRDEINKINNAVTFADQLNKFKNVSSIIDNYSNHIIYKDSQSKNGNVATNNHRHERSINLEDQEFFNAQNDAIFTTKNNQARKRRDESTVRGYENNNDQALFYGPNNANSSLKGQQVTSGVPSSAGSHRRKRRNDTVRGYKNNNDQALFYGQNNAKFTIKNNQATSGTNKLSSWINTAFGFATKGISQLGGFFSSTKASFATINAEHPSQQTSAQSDSLTQRIDVDGTILLLDVFIRKLTGQRYIAVNQDISLLEVQADALNITEEFGKILSTTFNISAKELIDLAEVQSNIFKAMMSGNGERIPKILYSCVEEAKLEPGVTKKILSAFQPTKPTASTLGGQTKHLPYLPETAYDKPQTCLSNIKVENSSVQLCRAV